MNVRHVTLPVLVFLACAAPALLALHVQGRDADACTPAIVSRLYLGQSTPAGDVTAAAWTGFVADAVAPRFPDGFTELAAFGHWRDRDGRAQEESTRILEVAHDDTPAARAHVLAIARDYRVRFAQQSVLVTHLPARQCAPQAG